MAMAHEDYIERARLLAPEDRAKELACAGVPSEELAAALWSEGHDLPAGYVLPALERHELYELAGRAHQRHVLYLHGVCDASTAAFNATNKLGYTRGPMDKELGAAVKGLQDATRAELLERFAEIARRLGVTAPALARDREAVDAQVTQLGPGTQRACGTELGTVLDVEPETP